jgi:hypothetical protein
MGKLVITDKYIQFRSLHFDVSNANTISKRITLLTFFVQERIPFDDILAVKKKGGAKLNIRTKNEAHSFGPFDDIRRGSVYETIKAIIDEVGKFDKGNAKHQLKLNPNSTETRCCRCCWW